MKKSNEHVAELYINYLGWLFDTIFSLLNKKKIQHNRHIQESYVEDNKKIYKQVNKKGPTNSKSLPDRKCKKLTAPKEGTKNSYQLVIR